MFNEITFFEELTQHELIIIDGGAEEDRRFGELMGNAFVYAVAEVLPDIPFITKAVKNNARNNIFNWYKN